MEAQTHWVARSDRPDLMLITNHGYAGVEIPVGGAPDTGGQNFYVNSLAVALERLGYRVTIVARGGFPFFESDRTREGTERLSEHVRYVYVPGGGETFLRKEDIAIALDEEVAWLDDFIRAEAAERGTRPWEVYQVINTHYWDAAVLGMRLVERWRNDIALDVLRDLLDPKTNAPSLVSADAMQQKEALRHYQALADGLPYHLGRLLLDAQNEPRRLAAERVGRALARFGAASGWEATEASQALEARVREATEAQAPALHILTAASALGEAVLERLSPSLEVRLEAADRHVWTPHSIGDLKAENYRDKPEEVVQALKFCERRNHERTVCARTRYFVATSEEIAERLHTSLGVRADQVFYFPPCVDRALFRRYDDAELAPTYRYLSEKSGIDEATLRGAKVVFETSRMDRTKRKDLLLEAFAQVAPEVDDTYLFIGGGPESAPLFGELRQLLKSLPSLQGRAFLLGFIPEEHLAPLFGLADVFASASEMEGFGMSAAQAAGAGAAVVLSDLIPFAVQYVPEAAIVFPAGDRDALAAGLRQTLTNDKDRAARVAKLMELTRVLDWDVQSDRFLEHLRRAGLSIAAGVLNGAA